MYKYCFVFTTLTLNPGLNISRKDVCDHIFGTVQVWLSRYIDVMVASIDLSLKIFAIDILTTLKSSLKHRRKHALRSLRLFGDKA